MPSSLIIGAFVVAWLLVLVPIVARRRQEVARTADSALAARIVRSCGAQEEGEEEIAMPDTAEADTARDHEFEEDLRRRNDFGDEPTPDDAPEDGDFGGVDVDGDYAADVDSPDYQEMPARPYRPGRGGFDPEAAAISARAKYAFRQRVVLFLLLLIVGTALGAVFLRPVVWWAHGAVDVLLVSYLTYLRRQVRIEEEVRQRRQARLAKTRHTTQTARPRQYDRHDDAQESQDGQDDGGYVGALADESPKISPVPRFRPAPIHPGTVVVDADDEDPAFADLEEPDVLPYRRAVGE